MLILQGNSVTIDHYFPLKDKSVQLCLTSPPYLCQRIYGDSKFEYGQESLSNYIENWLFICNEVHRVLKDSGLFIFNVDDKNNESGGAGGDHSTGSKQHIPKYGKVQSHLKGKQELNVPNRMAVAMQESGRWMQRKEIIWDKGKLERTSGDHVRRPKKQYEKIFMFSKQVKSVKDYKFYVDRLDEPGDIWRFSANNTGDKGYAPFPDELARRCILPATDAGDIVFDPFSGSGTSVRVAESLGRRGIGVELYL